MKVMVYAIMKNPVPTAKADFHEFNSRRMTANVARQGMESKLNSMMQNACSGV
jgi:hypothetical protein